MHETFAIFRNFKSTSEVDRLIISEGMIVENTLVEVHTLVSQIHPRANVVPRNYHLLTGNLN